MNKTKILNQLDELREYVTSLPDNEKEKTPERKQIVVKSKEAIRAMIMEKSELIKKDPAHHLDDYYC